MFVYAVMSITLAFIFYTGGVWSEKFNDSLQKKHLLLFWAGLIFDIIGTALMGELAGGAFKAGSYGIIGAAAIVLMLTHTLWATAVLLRGREKSRKSFHRFSMLVWVIWLIPYLWNMALGM